MKILLFLVILSVAVKARAYSTPKYRLSGDVEPSFYSIKLHPNLDTETFTGEVFIHIKVNTLVDYIALHASPDFLRIKKLFFDTKEVYNGCFCRYYEDDYTYHFSDFELIKIFRGDRKSIGPGTHVLRFEYEGKFSNTTEGMFKGTCSKNGTTQSTFLATDFETIHARKVFPCFDEPRFKAHFQLNLVVPNSTFTALSNMRALEVFQTFKGTIYKFERTPLMSTYLLSFAITEHSYIEYSDSEVPFRIYSFEASDQNDTSLLEFSSRVLDFYTNYTEFKYTLPKVDFIGFDRYLSSATENWGLVTFNTSLLSSDNDVYDEYQKKAVIAHELAHFWFGNLVTNDWWHDIWLQESFASFMSIKAEEFVLKNQASKYFYTTYTESLFSLEQTQDTHPVVSYVESPVKIRDSFNEVTYNKGATVLRMLEVAIGEVKLRQALMEYIKKFAFKTATTEDFLAILDNVVQDPNLGLNLREFMETYLYQSKFPIIYIEEREEDYILKQKPFGSNENRWTVPITYTTDTYDTATFLWFQKDANYVSIPKNNATWIKLNDKSVGYYKVRYSDQLLKVLLDHIKELEPWERVNLFLETMTLFEINEISCDIILKYLWNVTTKDFSGEFVFSVYLRLKSVIEKYDDDAVGRLKEYFGQLQNKVMKRYSDDYDSSKHRGEKKKATKYIAECIQWLKNESQEYYTDH